MGKSKRKETPRVNTAERMFFQSHRQQLPFGDRKGYL